MKQIFLLLLVTVAILASGYYLYLKTTTMQPTWKDVPYSDISTRNVLDIYLPTGATTEASLPTVVWIHGGAFKMGSKGNPQSLSRLLEGGYAVVSINYRLSSEAIWPAQLEDLENVLTFINTEGEQYGLDKNRVAVWGASAGGYLASMTGVALATSTGTTILAVVDWYGPVSFFDMDADIATTGVTRQTGNNGDADSPESALLGKTIKENKDASYQASPLFYIEKVTSLPSYLIMHGAKDPMIGAPQSERLYNAITSKFGNSSAEYHLLPEGTHGGGDFKTTAAENTVIEFLNRNMK